MQDDIHLLDGFVSTVRGLESLRLRDPGNRDGRGKRITGCARNTDLQIVWGYWHHVHFTHYPPPDDK
jgi:hypothetical protein